MLYRQEGHEETIVYFLWLMEFVTKNLRNNSKGYTMKFITLFLLIAGCLLFSASAFANNKVHCGPAKLEQTYQSEEAVYVKLAGQGWHVLGFDGDNDLAKKLNRLDKAERKGRFVELVFPKGYDTSCMVTDHNVAVKKVKLKSSVDGPDEES